MPFCSSCGKQVADGLKFCTACGKPMAGAEAAKPRTVTVGQVKKCPSCGAPLESFQSRCPQCGHELGGLETSGVIKEFSNKIIELDDQIAKEKQGLNQSNINIIKKFGWVIINIPFLAIPYIISTIKKVLVQPIPPLVPTEEKKKSYIENFVVPNNREDIMEFVLFASSRVDGLMGQSGRALDELGAINMWAKIWSDKCKQVSARAGIVMTDDKKTMSQINDLMAKPQKMLAATKKKALTRVGVFAAVVIAVAAIIIVPSLGIGLAIPAAKTIETNIVSFTGSLDGYFEVVSCSFEPQENGSLIMMLGVKANKATQPVIERKIAEKKKELGWENASCDSWLSYGYISLGEFYSEMDVVRDILNMDVDTTKIFTVTLNMSGNMTKKKKELIKIMALSNYSLSTGVSYKLSNEDLRSKTLYTGTTSANIGL